LSARTLEGRHALVTGATGFLGAHLLRALLARGMKIHALRRQAAAAARLPCEGVTWHEADMTDPEGLRRAVEVAAPEVVFHLAAYGTTPGQRDASQAYRVNVEGAWNLWRALEGTDCRLVHAGSCGEYGPAKGPLHEDQACRPTWFYPATKHASVVLLSTLGREAGREVIGLRPFGPYGPADAPDRLLPEVTRALLEGREIAVTAGEQVRDYLHVDDHATAFVLAATHELARTGEVYNVGSGEGVTVRALCEMVADAVGAGALGRIRFGALPYRPDEVWEMVADIGAARRDLGFTPRVSLREGVARTVAWYRDARRTAG
jgi:nucleoside-diphosphate-sugar epimerase